MLFLLFAVVSALAPFYPAQNPHDKDGLREHMVVFTNDAPRFGHNVEKLRDWVKQDLSAVDPAMINEIWSIGTNFSAFPVWLSPAGVLELRQHGYVQLVEESTRWSIDPREMDTTNVQTLDLSDPDRPTGDFITRVQWGGQRVDHLTNYLQTTPADLFLPVNLANDGYPDGGAPTTTWNWNGPVYSPINQGAGAFVWVLDTGINSAHQEFANLQGGGSRVTIAVDCSGDNTPANCPAANVPNGDLNGHGSHCAGTCCGNYRGMAPKSGLASVRIFDDSSAGFSTWTTRGINYVANNQQAGFVNIASMSVGGDKSETNNMACDAAVDAGVLVVVAAGNEGADASAYSPASAAKVVCVGATDASDTRAGFSNFGADVDIFAPGVQIHSAWMTTDAQSPNVYNQIDGTSMATPTVAGALALFVTKSPNASPTSAKAVLYRYAVKGIVLDSQSPAQNNRFLYSHFSATLDDERTTPARQNLTNKD